MQTPMYVVLTTYDFLGKHAYPFYTFAALLACLQRIPSQYLDGYAVVDYEMTDIDMKGY